ncbi:MAG TPA: OsmC family protein [Gaiellaceae bacterium]|nr:OsmC family protein [Gaiellaceae bacterium]
MSVVKELQFPISVRWRGGRLAHADAHGKETLALSIPPEFRSGLEGPWTPEDLLVTSVASSFALTLAALAARREAPLIDVTVTATGHMSRRDDGSFGFTVIEADAALETIPGGEDAVMDAAREAERHCLVTRTLDIPVHLACSVTAVADGPRSRRGAERATVPA